MSTCVAALYAAAGGAPATTSAQDLVDTWASGGAGSDGFAMVFEDAGGTDAPSIYVKDSGTPANDTDVNLTDDFDAFNSFFTYTSPSPKIVRQSDGDLKYCAHNLCAYSNAFSTSAGWDLAAATVSTGQADPDGGSNAFKLVEDSSTAFHNINTATTYKFAVVSGQQYRAAVKVKAAELTYVQLLFGAATMGVGYRNFNLSAGTVASGSLFSGEIVDLGGGWYECAIIATATSSGTEELYIALTNDTDSTRALSYLGDGSSGLYIYQAQVSRWPADTTYLPTTTAARYALPIQHDSSNNAEGLLVEPAATNNITVSRDFSDAAYTATQTSVATGATSPVFGDSNACTLTVNVNADPRLRVTTTLSGSTTYVASIYAKYVDLQYLRLRMLSVNTASDTFFDLTNGTVASTGTGVTAGIAPEGTGYRCWIYGTTASSPTNFFDVSGSDATTRNVTTGGDIIIDQLQIEAGTVPTSPIITTGATATRAHDDILKALANIPFDNTDGTFYIKAVPYAYTSTTEVVYAGGSAGRLAYVLTGTNDIRAFDNTNVVSGGTPVPTLNTAFKFASKWDVTNGLEVSKNGGTTVSGSFDGTMGPGTGNLTLGANASAQMFHGLFQEILILPEDLSDANIESITT